MILALLPSTWLASTSVSVRRKPEPATSSSSLRRRRAASGFRARPSSSFSSSRTRLQCRAHKVELEYGETTTVLEVEDGETILSVALDAGLDLPHDCKLGVCMTCPAKIVSGEVDQSEGMLSDDVQEKGYALMCASYPKTDCKIRVIPEEELLSLQLVTAAQ